MKRLKQMSGNIGQGRVCFVAKPCDPVVIHACGAHEGTGGLGHIDCLVRRNADDGSVGFMC